MDSEFRKQNYTIKCPLLLQQVPRRAAHVKIALAMLAMAIEEVHVHVCRAETTVEADKTSSNLLQLHQSPNSGNRH